MNCREENNVNHFTNFRIVNKPSVILFFPLSEAANGWVLEAVKAAVQIQIITLYADNFYLVDVVHEQQFIFQTSSHVFLAKT